MGTTAIPACWYLFFNGQDRHNSGVKEAPFVAMAIVDSEKGFAYP